jgi:hypothetical protein
MNMLITEDSTLNIALVIKQAEHAIERTYGGDRWDLQQGDVQIFVCMGA